MITINNNYYTGKNLTIINGKVYVDRKDVTPDAKEINISVDGNVEKLEVDYAWQINIKGDVNTAQTGSGDINCNNIYNGANTGSGDIKCSNIAGNVKTGSGDVTASSISGSVTTGSGDVDYRFRK